MSPVDSIQRSDHKVDPLSFPGSQRLENLLTRAAPFRICSLRVLTWKLFSSVVMSVVVAHFAAFDVTWTLILLVDTSLVWIGAVLLQGDSAGEERPIASRQLQPCRFCYVPSADETTLERTVSVGIRWMMILLDEWSPSLCDRDFGRKTLLSSGRGPYI